MVILAKMKRVLLKNRNFDTTESKELSRIEVLTRIVAAGGGRSAARRRGGPAVLNSSVPKLGDAEVARQLSVVVVHRRGHCHRYL